MQKVNIILLLILLLIIINILYCLIKHFDFINIVKDKIVLIKGDFVTIINITHKIY